jgi:heat shock protein HslJ
MKTKIISILSAMVLLNACSPKQEETPPGTTSTTVMSQASVSSVAVSSAASIDTNPEISNQPTTATGSSVLIDTYWRLTALEQSEIVPSPHQREAHLIFNTDNRVGGSDGCNTLGGTYTIENETLSFSDLNSTKVACEEAGNTADSFNKALERVNSFTIHADQLELRDETGLVLARFQAAANPSANPDPNFDTQPSSDAPAN